MKGIRKIYSTIIFLALLVGLPSIICADEFSRVHVINQDSSYGMLRVMNSKMGKNEATMAFVEGSDNKVTYWITGVGPWNANGKFVIGYGSPKLTITPSGSVGIGTINPENKLEIEGNVLVRGENAIIGLGGFINHHNIRGESGTGVVISAFAAPDALTVRQQTGNVGIGTIDPGTKLDVNGTTRTKILEITGGSDLSEQFDISKPHNLKNYIKQEDFTIEPGMVACIDPESPGKLLVSSKAYDRTVAGIISGAGGLQPGMLMGQKGSTANGKYPVALTGRVYCKADATYGPIQPGDLLTTSDTPGYVMKVSDYDRAHGATIGKAMSSLNDDKGQVLVLVTLQ